jgi:SAM-dependent methyltransferase
MTREQIINKLRANQKSHSIDGLIKFSSLLTPGSTVLDVGSGPFEYHANILRIDGYTVDTCDFHDTATYKGNFNDIEIPIQYDGVWSAHCLEHQLNVNAYLRKVSNVCKDDGLICVTVPPLKHLIVGGHTTLWNAGLVLYNMVLAGLDCSEAKVKTYKYNISVIVKKKTFEMPQLKFIGTDLGVLRPYFPTDLPWVGSEGRPKFDGQVEDLNW